MASSCHVLLIPHHKIALGAHAVLPQQQLEGRHAARASQGSLSKRQTRDHSTTEGQEEP
jgi:hypothetical protein